MAPQHRIELFGARRLRNVAVEIDPDPAGFPRRDPLQEFGELAVPQWPAPAPTAFRIADRDIVFSGTDQHHSIAGRGPGPGDQESIVDRQFYGLQPALAAYPNHRGYDDMSADHHSQSPAAQQLADPAAQLQPITHRLALLVGDGGHATVAGPLKTALSPLFSPNAPKLWNRLPPTCLPRSAVIG